MSFNRAIYDPCAYNKRLDESTSVLTYRLDPNKFYNCNQCRIGFGTVGGNQVSLTGCNLVDLESDLRNQTRLYSLCPEKKYLPNCNLNCKSNLGLPCGNRYCRCNNLNHLPECNIVQYKPRIDHVGYELNYAPCPKAPSLVCRGNTRLPTATSRTYPRSKKKVRYSHAPIQYGYRNWQSNQ